MLLSVIIPVYNAKHTVCRCVDSILCQRMQDYEVILVDDGSTDNSLAVCNEYAEKDARVKVIHKSNGGVSSARNIGIEASAGEWVCFIDADDYIEQDFFPNSFSDDTDLYVQNYKCFGTTSWDAVEFEAAHYSGEKLSEFWRDNMQRLQFLSPWGKFYRADIIKRENIRFDSRFRCGEDCLFNMRYYSFVNSLEVLNTGKYMYFRNEMTRKEYAAKFGLSVDEVIEYLHELYRLYKLSKYKCPALLESEMSGFRYNSALISKTPLLDKMKWLASPTINAILNELGYGAGAKGLIRNLVARSFKITRNC